MPKSKGAELSKKLRNLVQEAESKGFKLVVSDFRLYLMKDKKLHFVSNTGIANFVYKQNQPCPKTTSKK